MATLKPRMPFTFPDSETKVDWQERADKAGFRSLNAWMIQMILKGIAADEKTVDLVEAEVISPDLRLETAVEVYSGIVQQVAIDVDRLVDDKPEVNEFRKRYEKYLNLKSEKSRTKALSDLLDEMRKFWPSADDRPKSAIDLYGQIFKSKNEGVRVSYLGN